MVARDNGRPSRASTPFFHFCFLVLFLLQCVRSCAYGEGVKRPDSGSFADGSVPCRRGTSVRHPLPCRRDWQAKNDGRTRPPRRDFAGTRVRSSEMGLMWNEPILPRRPDPHTTSTLVDYRTQSPWRCACCETPQGLVLSSRWS
uniref:Putative secreted protein n=1 Tax=Ixodes scapularis TaxID=6945 RepID=A0A4D5S7A6_IXOSC